MSTVPASTTRVLAEVRDERARQEQKWGEQNHPNLPQNDLLRPEHNPALYFLSTSANAERKRCEHAFEAGRGSYAHIFVEEVAEALEDAHRPAKLRAELVQVAAVAVAWIEKIDRDTQRELQALDTETGDAS